MMSDIDVMSVNAIRALAADTVQKANSGHPGLPLGAAPMAYELWVSTTFWLRRTRRSACCEARKGNLWTLYFPM